MYDLENEYGKSERINTSENIYEILDNKKLKDNIEYDVVKFLND